MSHLRWGEDEEVVTRQLPSDEGASYRAHDWEHDVVLPEQLVPGGDIVIVEGLYALHGAGTTRCPENALNR